MTALTSMVFIITPSASNHHTACPQHTLIADRRSIPCSHAPPMYAQVYACEWNPHAVEALRRGLKANGVEGR